MIIYCALCSWFYQVLCNQSSAQNMDYVNSVFCCEVLSFKKKLKSNTKEYINPGLVIPNTMF